MKALIIALTGLILSGCDSEKNNSAMDRGFSPEQIALGEKVFETYCQECHGAGAAGVVREWQKPLPDGTLPAPPLNGSAHAWHHNDKVLLRTVNQGGIPLGGRMPAFKDVLSQEQKHAVLSYIKSLWPDALYAAWKERNTL